jgi:hypothetical protein
VVDHTDVAGPTFTLAEARALLPRVRALAERMVERRRLLTAAQERRARALAHISGNGGDYTPVALAGLAAEVEREATAVARAVRELTELGVQVKDLDAGLVDFPALRGDGERVLLCWRLGEDAIGWWHREEDGFGGRRPIADF